MDARISALVTNPNDSDFNAIQFEKKLMQLKDSQESINSLSAWCLENRAHHKKIVTAWLNVLKKVKVEQRLTLFYLANDVIQYSKRKNYDFVESWGTTLQKATTLVREEKVKTRILRIFKIWEQRGIYGEEFITDLSGLISASPAGRKFDQDPQDFQPSYLISRLRSCAKLESDTDLKLKVLKDANLKIGETETLCASVKDRKQVEEIEAEVDKGINLIEGYVNALKAEIKSRTHLIACLAQADTFYSTERKEVKVVVSAYKNFATRVKNLQKKLDELIPTLNSPIPSPDVNAPSPEPDSDTELPNPEAPMSLDDKIKCNVASGVNVYSLTENYSANYYTPASSLNQEGGFANNGFTSFMGSNTPFNLQNFNTNNLFSDQNHTDSYSTSSLEHHHPEPVPHPGAQPYESSNYNPNAPSTPVASAVYQTPQQQPVYNPVTAPQPLLPPPLPPFTTAGYIDNPPYTDSTYAGTDSYTNNSSYEPIDSAAYAVSSEIQSGYPQPGDAYNPEEELETWEPESTWDAPPDLETPESPPMFEKEGFADPIEYDETKSNISGIGKDVDHRVLMPPLQIPAEISGSDTDHRVPRMGNKDVDHRNLISLTGSPHNDIPVPIVPPALLQPPPAPPSWPSEDQDYRNSASTPIITTQDQDYRLPVVPAVPVDIAQQLKLPPPPPPPPKNQPFKDNVESIDMDLSDDEVVVAPRFENELINCEIDSGNSEIARPGKLEMMMPPPMPQFCELNPPNWGPEEWFDGNPIIQERQDFDRFPPNFHQRGRKKEFRGGFRGRGRGGFSDEGFRGRAPRNRGGRTRPFRGGYNNRRGHRGQFRGGF